MSSEKKTIEAVVAVLPIAVDLAGKLVGLVKLAKSEGIDVPSIEELRGLNKILSELDDL